MVYHGYVHSSSCNGTSILPTLNTINLSLAHKIHTAIITYSHSICKITKNKIAEELTEGFRLLGTPIGSTEFANQFFNEQLQSITTQASLLTDQQSDLSNYSTRVLSKNCHTYSAATSCTTYPTTSTLNYGTHGMCHLRKGSTHSSMISSHI